MGREDEKMTQQFTNAAKAVAYASRFGNHCVGWSQQLSRWLTYDPTLGAPEGCIPEFFCFMAPAGDEKTNGIAVPLSADAIDVLFSIQHLQGSGS